MTATAVFLGTALLSPFVGAFAWRKHGEAGNQALAATLFCLGPAAGAYAAFLQPSIVPTVTASLGTTPRIVLALFAVVLGMCGFAAWFVFGLAYSGRERWLSTPVVGAIALPILVVGMAIAVPQLHSLVYTNPTMTDAGVEFDPGPLFGLAMVYMMAVNVLMTLLLGRLFLEARHLYRIQAITIVAAIAAPWTAVIFHVAGWTGGHNFTIPTIAISATLMTAALYRFRVLDFTPTGREEVVEAMGDGVLVLDTEGLIGDCNPIAGELLDVDPGAVRGEHVETVFDAWEHLDVEQPDVGSDSSADARDWQEVSIDGPAGTRHLEVQVTPFFDHTDKHVGRLLLIRDVTERKERELDLQRYETTYHAVDENIYVLDGEGRFAMINDGLADAVGYSRSDLEGEHFEFLLAPGESFPFEDPSRRQADGGAVEVTVETADGRLVPCEAIHTPVTFEGEHQGIVGFLRDISERKRLESELHEVEGKLSTVVESSPLAVAVLDTDGTVTLWNSSAEGLFGWDRREVVGEPLPTIPQGIEDGLTAYRDRVLEGEQFTGLEQPMERRDGSRIETNVSLAPHFDTDGSVAGIVLIAEDITERKERERALRRQNEQLEQFASVVSHDLRNPLNVAEGYLEGLNEDLDRREIEEIDASLQRMGTIIEELLTLAREGQQIGSTEPVELDSVVSDAWSAVDTATATLEIEGSRTIEADEHRLAESLENLFRNSVEHVDGGVTVTVGTTDAGFYVEDDGPGIPEDEREAVFDHGYTTAADGTGFGLAIVDTIAGAHGWSVAVTRGTAGGARFEFDLNEEASDDREAVPVDGSERS